MHNYFIFQQYICYTTLLNMFRAARCSSSGGPIVSPQPLVSSPSVSSRTICRWRAELSTCEKVPTTTNKQLCCCRVSKSKKQHSSLVFGWYQLKCRLRAGWPQDFRGLLQSLGVMSQQRARLKPDNRFPQHPFQFITH